MRSSKSRSRNKSNRQRSVGNVINRVFDSSGPEGKVRGTPQQIIDKYLMLARDAQLSNDRVAEQNFLQHAEHYTRMLGEAQREQAREQEARNQQRQQNQNTQGDGQNNGQNNGSDNGQNNGQNASQPPSQSNPTAEAARSDAGPRDTRGSDNNRRSDRRSSDESSAMMPPMPAPDETDSALVDTPESRASSDAAPVAEKSEKPEKPEKAEKSEKTEKPKRPRAPRKPRQPKAEPATTPESSSE
ncbi:DUF4167 domain-containing protein [Thioclava indica]|uniref:DUF4167 domain-containing protein n=1 Tax=Thioclava indica TaxID=1353528 RepID=A0A074KIK2_9RHOB|nr:DUF4167 domain-containing protein [Thioclava indica]KEO61397.1 hypothetical protein DT23_00075 [Thioclava indica]